MGEGTRGGQAYNRRSRKGQTWVHTLPWATGKYSVKATVSGYRVLLPFYPVPKDKTLGMKTRSAVLRG